MKKKKGLSIIEVVLFITILGLSIPPLLIVTANLYSNSINLETMHVASNLSIQKIEDAIGKEFNDLASEPPTNFGGQFSAYQYEVAVDYVSPDDLETPLESATNYKRVSVSVRDSAVSGRAITFTTVVTDE